MLEEFNKEQNAWKKMKAFMIMKVAIAQAHRLAFPEELGGIYIAEELEDVQAEKEKLLTEVYAIVKENPELEKVAKDFVKKKGKNHSTELEIDEIRELRELLLNVSSNG